MNFSQGAAVTGLDLPESSRKYIEKLASRVHPSIIDPLYSGRHLGDLYDYLRRPHASENHSIFAWSYTCSQSHDLEVKAFSIPASFDGWDDHTNIEEKSICLIILAGHPSPDWLNTVGSKFDIDPVFFQQHLDFRPTGQVDFYSQPKLPSSSRKTIRLSITTIGYFEPAGRSMDKETMQKLRTAIGQEMNMRFRELARFSAEGTPIVRRFHLHNERHFTIEQDVSIYVDQRGPHATLIAWLDSGSGIKDPETPRAIAEAFPKSSIKFCPTLLDRTSVSQQHPRPVPEEVLPNRITTRAKQTLAHFAANYGKTLDWSLANSQSFYALHELYEFAASAEVQFINMMEKMLAAQIEVLTLSGRGPDLSDVQYSRNILEQHIERLQETIDSIEGRNSMEGDFRYLLSRARALVGMCDRAMSIVMNNTAVVEAKRSYDLAEGVAGLTRFGTRLTLLYIPTSFLTSFFGMNFHQFGQGSHSLWLFFAVALPVFAVSCAFAVWDLWGMLLRFGETAKASVGCRSRYGKV